MRISMYLYRRAMHSSYVYIYMCMAAQKILKSSLKQNFVQGKTRITIQSIVSCF